MGNNVLDVDSSFHQLNNVTPLVAYDASTSIVLDIQGMNNKAILIKNTGGNSLDWRILGSFDGGATYDLTEKAEVALASTTNELYRFTNDYTHIKIDIKSTAGTTAVVKTIGQST
jgi:hypothetical protein